MKPRAQYYVRGTDKYLQLDPGIANVPVENWREIEAQIPKSVLSPSRTEKTCGSFTSPGVKKNQNFRLLFVL